MDFKTILRFSLDLPSFTFSCSYYGESTTVQLFQALEAESIKQGLTKLPTSAWFWSKVIHLSLRLRGVIEINYFLEGVVRLSG